MARGRMSRIGLVSILLVLVASIVSGSSPATATLPKPYVSADQGGTAYAPENTMVAMRNGIRLGVDELEADINMTLDKQLVLIHDGSLDRTTNCHGNVKSKTLAQVLHCDAAYSWTPGVSTLVPGPGSVVEHDRNAPHPMRGKGVRVPTVREFFTYIVSLGDRAPQVTIEIKNIPYDTNFDPLGHRVADVLVPLIQEYDLTAKTVVESFWPTSLERVKQLNPAIRTMFLTLGSALANYAYVAVSATEFSSSDTLAPDLNRFYVNHVHARGKKVVPWLVDAESDWAKVRDLGVDGVISSYPACIMLAMGRTVPQPYVTPEAGPIADVSACP
jgi:glycerophosphoryl diester phosphodiesterase